MKKLVFLLFIALSILDSSAQEIIAENKGEKIRFNILENSYTQMNNLYFNLDLLNAQIGESGYSGFAGFGLNLRYKLAKKVDIDLKYSMPYTKETDAGKYDFYDRDYLALPNIRTYINLEIGSTYALVSKQKMVKSPIHVSSDILNDDPRVAYYKQYTILETEIPRTVQTGVRTGWLFHQQSYGRTALIGFDLDSHAVYFNSNTLNSIYLGVSFTKFEHIKISSEKYKTVYKNFIRTYYIDYLFGIAGKKDYHSFNGYYITPFESDLINSIKRHGIRFGIDYYYGFHFAKGFGYKFGFELGWRPNYSFTFLEKNNFTGNYYEANVPQIFSTLKLGIYFSSKTHSI